MERGPNMTQDWGNMPPSGHMGGGHENSGLMGEGVCNQDEQKDKYNTVIYNVLVLNTSSLIKNG